MKASKILPKSTNQDDSDDENIMMMQQEAVDNHVINIDSLKSPKQLEIKEYRRVRVPDHRYTPLKKSWEKIVTTIVHNLDLDIRMNAKRRCVELRTNKDTKDKLNVQKAADFLKSFMLGFDLNDSIAMLRLNDLYLESFEVRDVKPLHGEHLSRCIGRISGEKGKTKNAIENATRTRIVLADSKIHIMGSYGNIRHCRAAICNLILGSPAGKVYSQLRYIAQRYKDHA